MTKVRLMGESTQIQKTIAELGKIADILQISEEYVCRNSQYVRVYLDIDIKANTNFAVDCKNKSVGGI